MSAVLEWLIILLVGPFLIGYTGHLVQKHVLGPKAEWPNGGKGFKGFQKFYHVTVGWHALLVGMLVWGVGYLISIPVPEAFGDGVGGALVAGAFAGGVAMIGYDTIVKTIRRMIGAAGDVVGGGSSDRSAYDDLDK